MIEKEILSIYKNIAIVGLSPSKEKDSFRVATYLKEQGYNIIPVNPFVSEVLGLKSYPDLLSIKDKVDIVDIFRKSSEIMPIIDESIKIGAKVIWMQEGVVNEEAAERAKKAGLIVVMDKCIKKTHQKLFS